MEERIRHHRACIKQGLDDDKEHETNQFLVAQLALAMTKIECTEYTVQELMEALQKGL